MISLLGFRTRYLSFGLFLTLIIAWNNSYAYRIHAESDTVYVHAMRGSTGQPNIQIISSRANEDSSLMFEQGYDTVRVSLSAGSEFAWGASYELSPIPFLASLYLYLEYSPTSLSPSTATITVQGDSNTIQIVVIGIPDTNFQCLKFGGGTLPYVAEGQTGMLTDTLFNLTDSVVTIDSLVFTQGDSGVFSFVSPSLPITIAANSYGIMTFSATIPNPALAITYAENFRIYDHGTSSDGAACASLVSTLSVPLLVPSDTVLLQLPPAQDTVVLDIHHAISNELFVFQNALTDSIYLENAQLSASGRIANFWTGYGPHCTGGFFGGSTFCFDDSLAPGAWSDTAMIRLVTLDTGVYSLQLTLNYIDAAATQNYFIRAHYTAPAQSSVSIFTVPSVTDFSMYPNPAHDEVTITPLSSGNVSVSIFDVLGKKIFTHEGQSPFIWRESSNGINGTYIVRMTQIATNGEITVISKELQFIQ